MTTLVVGAGGQLATELVRGAPANGRVVAISEQELDIRDAAAVQRAVRDVAPRAIVNAAAYTAVDKAESERDIAFAVNRDGARHLAEAARDGGAFFVHVSTDFVFDGSTTTPYAIDATPNPVSVYGASKWEGEQAVRSACPSAAIVRTAWVYAAHGRNFVATMLRLMRERGSVRVVNDQKGTPTSARTLASCCWRIVERKAAGTWHWTDGGVATWYEFACAIAELAHARGLLKSRPTVEPIRTDEYPTPARRPAYSVLETTPTCEKLGLRATPWRDALREVIEELAT